ncbi:MAG: hypothetical protein VXY53_04855, partial [Candidatus Thermoplasmatota archaeon]|nr:hypothetical protein [Candidatus Thermoplasmatota archaeon]
STSSMQDENYTIYLNAPNGWRLICDSVVALEEIKVSSEFSGIIERLDTIGCELVNQGGPYSGNVNVTVYDGSSTMLYSSQKEFEFNNDESGPVASISPITLGVSIVVLLVVVSFSVVIVNRRKLDNDIDDQELISGPPISGPPISGPPISTSIVQGQTNTQTQTYQNTNIPPIPETGLPAGWTMEQWQYYGQQYLDMDNRQ